MGFQSVADPGFANGDARSSATGASIEAPKAVPPPQKMFLTLDLKMSTSSAL